MIQHLKSLSIQIEKLDFVVVTTLENEIFQWEEAQGLNSKEIKDTKWNPEAHRFYRFWTFLPLYLEPNRKNSIPISSKRKVGDFFFVLFCLFLVDHSN
jgi:hypothetical protein